jgi:diamine N-acetyltransferase
MAQKLEFIPAKPIDAPLLGQLGWITFAETFGHFFTPSQLEGYLRSAFLPAKIASEMADPGQPYFLAQWEGLPVGYGKLKANFGPNGQTSEAYWQLQRIYVQREFLPKKIGAPLQDHLLAYARQNGAKRLWLYVHHANQRAIQFYLRTGWSETRRDQVKFGEASFEFLLMEIEL